MKYRTFLTRITFNKAFCLKLALKMLFVMICILFGTPGEAQILRNARAEAKLLRKLERHPGFFKLNDSPRSFKADSIHIDKHQKKLELFFRTELAYLPVREALYFREKDYAHSIMGRKYKKFELVFYAGNTKVSDLIPNFYRKSIPLDVNHFPPKNDQKKILLQRSGDSGFIHGLKDKHIALWPSHGLYYNQKLARWEWQRPRLHTTVEDMFTAAFVIPYLLPMLENAGAITFMPRERDIQPHEVIVDNDVSSGRSQLEIIPAIYAVKDTVQGFLKEEIITGHDNPFQKGTAIILHTAQKKNSVDDGEMLLARYVPDIPQRGSYAVYISYPENITNHNEVIYTVSSLNGGKRFIVDQSIGGGMWIYIGHFDFEKGMNADKGAVEIMVNASSRELQVGLDAVKIGGGMGNVARRIFHQPGETGDSAQWELSGRPRYMESARYFMQYSGVPDSTVYSLSKGANDYTDDYQSRGEWVNYLMRKPSGHSENRNMKGKGIPIDLSFAFHTDAGVTHKDSVIGTLAIYSAETDGGVFPSGQSRMSSRELTDMIQTQLVEDIRSGFNPEWMRRGLWDKKYSEAFRANVPTMLLELLSHQNLADMQYGLDPEFRFLTARAIYKGMLKYLSFQDQREYVVQPLPVDHFKIERVREKRFRLSWKPVTDPLESSAEPDSYRVYERAGDGAFRLLAAGILHTHFEVDLPAFDLVYSYRVVAENRGGVSFPGEILSVGLPAGSKGMMLVVNAFNRVSGPGYFDVGALAGFAGWLDEGVPHRYDFAYCGDVYDVERASLWLDNDNPGWGASHADGEAKLVPGNTFDFCKTHGEAIMRSGYGFVSAAEKAFFEKDFTLIDYRLVDIIFGEERTKKGKYGNKFEVMTPAMRQKLEECITNGTHLLISGAYIGTDMVANGDSSAIVFARDKLGYKWRSDHADKGGSLVGSGNFWTGKWHYNSGADENIYKVESPDAIEPAQTNASSILRYEQTGKSAGVLLNGNGYRVITLGFPFESMPDEYERADLMMRMLARILEVR